MEDWEFTALDPPAAQAVLAGVSSESERTRLRHLYARTRGFLVDGTGWTNPAAVALKDMPDADKLVRPFGMLGGTYRVNSIGLICYRAAAILAGVSIGAFALAHNFQPSALPWLFVGVFPLVTGLCVAAMLNGKRIADPPGD